MPEVVELASTYKEKLKGAPSLPRLFVAKMGGQTYIATRTRNASTTIPRTIR